MKRTRSKKSRDTVPLRAAEINDKKFEAEPTKIHLPGTIVWKSFQQSRISDTHRLNMEVDLVVPDPV